MSLQDLIALEISEDSSAPVELYEFYAADNSFSYLQTSSNKSYSLNFVKYQAEVIDRTSIIKTNNLNRNAMKISITKDNPFFKELNKIAPKTKIFVKISRIQNGDNTQSTLSVFDGEIESFKFNNALDISISASEINSRLSKNSLRYSYQNTCNHAQFSSACGLSFDSSSTTLTVTKNQSRGYILYNQQIRNMGNLVGALVKFQDQFRNVIDYRIDPVDPAKDYFVIDSEFDDLSDGSDVKLAIGCQKNSTICKSLGNFDNYIGFHYIPPKNPFRSGLQTFESVSGAPGADSPIISTLPGTIDWENK